MKEFIVNTRKVCKVECDIPVNDCPVAQMLLERGVKLVGGDSFPDYNTPTYVCAQTKNALDLKRAIMEMCMDCDVKAR